MKGVGRMQLEIKTKQCRICGNASTMAFGAPTTGDAVKTRQGNRIDQALAWALATEAMARMCAGRVRQQPPTICTPAANQDAARRPKSSGSVVPVQERDLASQPSPEL